MNANVTELLQRFRQGDKLAEAELIAAVHRELTRIASGLMRRERDGHTLQVTALVNEAYIRLVAERETDWHGRAHFFGVAAQVMRHILIDYARQKLAGKRGGGVAAIPIDDALVITHSRLEELLTIDEGLKRLEAESPRVAQVVVLRFFGGLSVEETAHALKTSTRSVKRDWNYARAWLKAYLTPEPNAASRSIAG